MDFSQFAAVPDGAYLSWNDYLAKQGYSVGGEDGNKLYQDDGEGGQRRVFRPREEFEDSGFARQWYDALNSKDEQGRLNWGTEFLEGPGKPGSTFFDENGVERYRMGAAWNPNNPISQQLLSLEGFSPDLITYDPRYGYNAPMWVQNAWHSKFQAPGQRADTIQFYSVPLMALGGALASAYSGVGAGATELAGSAFPSGAIEGGLTAGAESFGGAAAGAAGGAGALPESYWNMLADSGGVVSDAAPAAAGSVATGTSNLSPAAKLLVESFGLSPETATTLANAYQVGSAASSAAGLAGGGSGANAGGLDGIMGDSLANYTASLGANNPATTSGGSIWGNVLSGLGGATGITNADGSLNYGRIAQLGVPLVGSFLQNNALRSAAGAQQGATDAAIAEQRRQFDLTRSDYAPYRQTGYRALSSLESDINRMPTSEEVMAQPGYQFGLKQGQQALDRKFAASGGRVSGAALKSAAQFGTDYATTGYQAEYGRRQDRLNRLAALAGVGQTAVGGTAAAGQNSTNAITGLISNQGDATAAANLGRGNIWGNALNQLAAQAFRSPSTYYG